MKVCIYGLGSIGKRHLKNLHEICQKRRIPLEVHAVRSTKSDLPNDLASLVSRQYFLNPPPGELYDAVLIANPTALHWQTIAATKEISQCFFVEKPVFNGAGCRLESLCLPKENRYYVAAPLRYTGVITYLADVIKQMPVYSIRAISSSYLPDWRPDMDYRNVYSAHKELGGGVAIDLIHEWDYLTYFMGFPQKVLSMIGRVSQLEINSEDIAIYLGDYGDKFVELHLDYFGRVPQRKVELFMQDTAITGDILGGKILYGNGQAPILFQESPNEKYIREMEYFLSLVENPALDSTNTLEHAIKILQLAAGIYSADG